ncbi:hypothetical protein C7S13_6126 [Burkholderia cepacia]|nr:hypothetical protein [Burkholderia cepacia]
MKELRKKSVRARWTNRHDVAMRTRASIDRRAWPEYSRSVASNPSGSRLAA